MVITKPFQHLKPVLMDPKVSEKVKEPYFLIKSEDQVIYVVSPGKNGIEYNKTEGFLNRFPGVLNYQCLFGQGVMLLQRNDSFGEAKEFKIVSLSPGRQVELPASSLACLVNLGSGFLVVLQNSAPEEKFLDSKPIIAKQGLAYYLIEKKGEVAFVQNPHYLLHPQITSE